MFPEFHPIVTSVLSVIVAVVLILAPLALAYVLAVFIGERTERPGLFVAVVVSDIIGTAAGAYLALIAYVRMTDRIVPPWALPELSAIAAVALLLPVLIHAAAFLRIRS